MGFAHTSRTDDRLSRTRSTGLNAKNRTPLGSNSPRNRQGLGLQLFATQHVGALGDLLTTNGLIADVTGNYWSLGASMTISGVDSDPICYFINRVHWAVSVYC